MWGTSELTCHNVPIAFPVSFDAFRLSTSVAWLVTSSARFSFSPHQCFVDAASRLPNRSSPLTLASSLDGLSTPSGCHGAHQSAPRFCTTGLSFSRRWKGRGEHRLCLLYSCDSEATRTLTNNAQNRRWAWKGGQQGRSQGRQNDKDLVKNSRLRTPTDLCL